MSRLQRDTAPGSGRSEREDDVLGGRREGHHVVAERGARTAGEAPPRRLDRDGGEDHRRVAGDADDPRQQDYVKDGWNLPGDTFVMDMDGYFSYQARNDDMIISAGYNIAGPEVEGALLQHTAVAECGVVGMPDEDRGQIVQAFVVLKPGHTGDAAMEKALQEHVKQTIAPFKYPRKVVFMDVLPRTETGKLQRFKLRQIS